MITRQNGGNQAGGIERAQRFDNSRAESDQAPGLSFYRNRYYDQATGRWLTEDPIGIAGGANLYAYAGNNPASFVDPFGLGPCDNLPPEACKGWLALAQRAEEAGNDLALGVVGLVSSVSSFFGAGQLWQAGTGVDAQGDAMTSTARLAAAGLGMAAMFPAGRLIEEGELGVRGLTRFKGYFGVKGGTAVVRVEEIQASGANPFAIVNRLKAMGKAEGANVLRIEGSLANPEPYDLLVRRYGLQSSGATDYMLIRIK